MENIQIILSVGGTALGLLITTITFLTKFIKNLKVKKVMDSVIKIGNAVLPFIQKAEEFTAYTGEEKKEYVMTKANQFAIENGIKFDKELVSQKIEELVAMSNNVNVKKKEIE